jgi:hypothetical protein
MASGLPSLEVALGSLSQHGYYFPHQCRTVTRLHHVTYQDDDGHIHPMGVDTYALTGVSKVYADTPVRCALANQGDIRPAGLADAVRLLSTIYSDESRLVWGFAGYASAGWSYAAEARGMKALFDCFHHYGRRPSLITNGGTGKGVLGLSNAFAKRFSVPSMGFIPKEGLTEFGPCDHLVVHKETYPQREGLVAWAPDTLTVWGGDKGAKRECIAACKAGSVVLIMALRDYGKKSFTTKYEQFEAVRDAIGENRLKVCRRMEDIQPAVRWALQAAERISVPRRATRLRKLNGYLTA